MDQAVIATLEAEAARLASELAEADQEAALLAPQAEELAVAEAALARARTSYDQDWADGVPALTSRAAEVRGELAALKAGLERGEAELVRATSRLAALTEKLERLTAEADRLRADAVSAETAEEPLVARLAAAEEQRAAAEAQVAAADAALRAADGERHAWTARAEALALALDEARSRAGAERLASVAGVVGTLLDLVDIDAGWEVAVEAAAGEALAAVVVDGVDAARAALAVLHGTGEGLAGAVLALGAARSSRPSPGDVGEAVRAHVRAARPDVEALLDALLGHAVAVAGGWSAAVDAALAHPELVVVTREGGRYGASGWRVGTASTGATGAALDEARERAAAATSVSTHAEASLHGARSLLDEARQLESGLARELDENDARLTAATDGLQRVEADRRDAATEDEALRSHSDELGERLARERSRVAELEAALPLLEAEEAERGRAGPGDGRGQGRSRGAGQRGRSACAADLEVRAAGLEDRRQFLRRRLSEVETRLEGSVEARREAEVAPGRPRRQAGRGRPPRRRSSPTGSPASRPTWPTLRERRRRQNEASARRRHPPR